MEIEQLRAMLDERRSYQLKKSGCPLAPRALAPVSTRTVRSRPTAREFASVATANQRLLEEAPGFSAYRSMNDPA